MSMEMSYPTTRSVEERAEIIVCSALARDYLGHRALEVEMPETVDLLQVFEDSRSVLRGVYAEPAGKLALHTSLKQRFVIVDEASERGVWQYTNLTGGERLAERIETALWPAGRVTDAVDRLVKKEEGGPGAVSRTALLRTLTATWRRLAALENERDRAETDESLRAYLERTRSPLLPPPRIKGLNR